LLYVSCHTLLMQMNFIDIKDIVSSMEWGILYTGYAWQVVYTLAVIYLHQLPLAVHRTVCSCAIMYIQ